mgnify:CR=1 FL=1
MTTDSECLFCKIVAGDIPATIRHQDEHITAFDDISPQAPTHILVIPNTHVVSLSETDDPEIYANVLLGIKEVAHKLGLKDFRVAINNGAGAGQTVFHLHAHLLSGRKLTWPPG